MANRFLSAPGVNSLQDGTADVYVASVTIAGLDPGAPVRSGPTATLETGELTISEVTNLQAELDSKVGWPAATNMDAAGHDLTDVGTFSAVDGTFTGTLEAKEFISEINVEASTIALNVDAIDDADDSGFYAKRVPLAGTRYTGLIRDAATARWHLFDNGTVVPPAGGEFATAGLAADLNVDGIYANSLDRPDAGTLSIGAANATALSVAAGGAPSTFGGIIQSAGLQTTGYCRAGAFDRFGVGPLILGDAVASAVLVGAPGVPTTIYESTAVNSLDAIGPAASLPIGGGVATAGVVLSQAGQTTTNLGNFYTDSGNATLRVQDDGWVTATGSGPFMVQNVDGIWLQGASAHTTLERKTNGGEALIDITTDSTGEEWLVGATIGSDDFTINTLGGTKARWTQAGAATFYTTVDHNGHALTNVASVDYAGMALGLGATATGVNVAAPGVPTSVLGTLSVTGTMNGAGIANGDLLVGTGASAMTRLAPGANGSILQRSAGTTAWVTPSGGGYLPLGGGTMSGAIAMGGSSVTGANAFTGNSLDRASAGTLSIGTAAASSAITLGKVGQALSLPGAATFTDTLTASNGIRSPILDYVGGNLTVGSPNATGVDVGVLGALTTVMGSLQVNQALAVVTTSALQGAVTFGSGGTTYTFPTARGITGQILVENGGGAPAWTSLATGNTYLYGGSMAGLGTGRFARANGEAGTTADIVEGVASRQVVLRSGTLTRFTYNSAAGTATSQYKITLNGTLVATVVGTAAVGNASLSVAVGLGDTLACGYDGTGTVPSDSTFGLLVT